MTHLIVSDLPHYYCLDNDIDMEVEGKEVGVGWWVWREYELIIHERGNGVNRQRKLDRPEWEGDVWYGCNLAVVILCQSTCTVWIESAWS